ncbi:hypothetical protein F4809DRAFT_202146 [Biscogniauxia mediterranea]|nr:hypothetical protein F4809DRAFT_202146 [Biscogniauxia mediterranea]
MAVLNQALAEGANFVARAIEYQIRQVTTTAIASSSPSPTQPPSSSISSTFSPTSSPTSNEISPSPSPTSTDNDNNNNNSGTNSPLLFFVALGFGVVFTNLWIIVGVKYCFRYNARNRQMRGLDENGEPINLENMPTRPHRRRREKKLMTMDEVNEKFPMMKYKTWVSERAREGLPTTGGVSAPPSRANSVRSVEGIVPDLPSKERESMEERPTTSSTPKPADKDEPKSSPGNPDSTSGDVANDSTRDATTAPENATETTTDASTKGHDHRSSVDEDDDDDEHINAALPPELMGTAGDTCAICIDTLEDDDDIRGLTCGHAFHAVCLDPWLTNRRACCPLCKADYYTPKPRPPPADGDPNNPTSPTAADPSRNNGRMNMPRAPQRTLTSWSNFREAPRFMFSGRFGGNTGGGAGNQEQQQRRWQRQRPDRPSRRTGAPQPVAHNRGESENGTWMSRFRGRFPPFRLNQMMQRNREGQSATVTTEPTVSGANGTAPVTTTPSQLEAGVRPSTTTAAN